MKGTRLVLAVMTLFAGNMNAGTEQQQIVDTVSTIFAAARADDVAKFDSVIASDFYIFDGGARFNGDSVMAFIKAQHGEAKLAGIGLPRKTGRQLEDRLHAQHSRSHDGSREPWQMKSKFSSSARLGSPVIGC